MKVLITADIHFGHPDKLDDITWAFRVILDHCVLTKINHILICGDIVYDRTSITHDTSNRISELLLEAKSKNINIIAFPGNHDMFNRYSWSINAIKPYDDKLLLIDHVSHFTLGSRKFWVLPFIESEKLYMDIVNKLNSMADDEDILLTHIGVNGATYNACFLYPNWNQVTFDGCKFKRIFAGHFHNHQSIGKLTYPGSPIAFRFDEGLVPHGFLEYDIDSDDCKFIDIYSVGQNQPNPPPDYVTISSSDIDENLVKDNIIKVQLNDGDNESEIRQKLIELGAKRVVITKPKEEEIKINIDPSVTVNTVFSSWLNHDNPNHLDRDLLIKLESEVRSDTRYQEESDD